MRSIFDHSMTVRDASARTRIWLTDTGVKVAATTAAADERNARERNDTKLMDAALASTVAMRTPKRRQLTPEIMRPTHHAAITGPPESAVPPPQDLQQ